MITKPSRWTLALLITLLPAPATAAVLNPGDFVMAITRGGGPSRIVAFDGATMVPTVVASGGYCDRFLDTDGGRLVDLAVTGRGEILVAVPAIGIVRVDPATAAQSLFVSIDSLQGGSPTGITVGPQGAIYVSVQGSAPGVLKLSPDGAVEAVVTSGGLLTLPAGLAFGPDGALYVCQTNPWFTLIAGGLMRVDPATGMQTSVDEGSPFAGPSHVAVAPDGSLWSTQSGSLRGSAQCLLRTELPAGPTDYQPQYYWLGECGALGIAIRADGVLVTTGCAKVHSDCIAFQTTQFPASISVSEMAGPIAVVPDLVVPTRATSWGKIKVMYR